MRDEELVFLYLVGAYLGVFILSQVVIRNFFILGWARDSVGRQKSLYGGRMTPEEALKDAYSTMWMFTVLWPLVVGLGLPLFIIWYLLDAFVIPPIVKKAEKRKEMQLSIITAKKKEGATKGELAVVEERDDPYGWLSSCKSEQE